MADALRLWQWRFEKSTTYESWVSSKLDRKEDHERYVF